jgi:hypothetical protein
MTPAHSASTIVFLRTWDYYFAYCGGALLVRHVGDVQLILAKNGTPGTARMFP